MLTHKARDVACIEECVVQIDTRPWLAAVQVISVPSKLFSQQSRVDLHAVLRTDFKKLLIAVAHATKNAQQRAILHAL